MKIIVEFMPGTDASTARQIVRDAIGEFADRRNPADEYVCRRYATQPEAFRARKLVSVRERIRLASSASVEVDGE